MIRENACHCRPGSEPASVRTCCKSRAGIYSGQVRTRILICACAHAFVSCSNRGGWQAARRASHRIALKTSGFSRLMGKVRVLFLPDVDRDNTNAQSLNVREIVLRLDPEKFDCTLWYEREPEPRLRNLSNVRLLQLPPRRKTLRILREMLAGHDLVAYMDYSPASYMFVRVPRPLRRAKAVMHVEAPTAQLTNPSPELRRLYEGVRSRCDIYTGITGFVGDEFYGVTKKRASYILPVGVDTQSVQSARGANQYFAGRTFCGNADSTEGAAVCP